MAKVVISGLAYYRSGDDGPKKCIFFIRFDKRTHTEHITVYVT